MELLKWSKYLNTNLERQIKELKREMDELSGREGIGTGNSGLN